MSDESHVQMAIDFVDEADLSLAHDMWRSVRHDDPAIEKLDA
jgi:hypothetical protein